MECPREGCSTEACGWYDRFGIYSGRACEKHAKDLPGQGDMWDYEPCESIDPEDMGPSAVEVSWNYNAIGNGSH